MPNLTFLASTFSKYVGDLRRLVDIPGEPTFEQFILLNGSTYVFYADSTAVVYSKFNAGSSSSLSVSSDRRPRHLTSDYNCVVETAGQWRVARCAEEHLTVCQSDHSIETGKRLNIDQRYHVVRNKRPFRDNNLLFHAYVGARRIFFSRSYEQISGLETKVP